MVTLTKEHLEKSTDDGADSHSVNSHDDEGVEIDSIGHSSSYSSSKVKTREEQLPEIAKKETATLNRVRIFVLIALLVPTVAIACAVYFYIRADEQKTFESYYEDNADKILESFGRNLDVLLEATESLVVATVSYAHSTNQTWPLVTLPDFASRTSIIRSLAKTAWIAEYTRVFPEDRQKWEQYSAENNDWVNASIEYLRTDKTWKGPVVDEYAIWNVIHDNGEFEKAEEEQGLVGTNRTADVYFPLWQNFPVVPYYPPTNWDLASIGDIEFIQASMQNNEALITYPYLGQVYLDPTDEAEIEEMGYEVDFIKDYIDPDDEPDEPVADLIYPIVVTADDFANVKDGDYTPSDRLTTVGLYSITYYWRELLRDILPEGQNGIHVVFDSCRTSFTYQVDGAETTYLGPIDAHDTKYNDLEVSAPLLEMSSGDYRGVPVSETYCPHFIRIYPSDTFKSQYTTNDPVYVTLAAVCFFAILHTLVFLVYDRLVQRRNRLVVAKANRTRAILSSLFPANVRKALFGDEEDEARSSSDGQTEFSESDAKGMGRSSAFSFVSTRRQLATFLEGSHRNESTEITMPGERNSRKNKPIAEVFTDTTVMFADIAGFTAWSSSREPAQVFTLLESIYSSFDVAAKNRGVFKVETVGDCYVAAAGVPEPVSNHAVIMAKFAAKCRSESVRLTRLLEVTLGPGTGDLRMRFGLHSGSVTAGVLRGDKARFQLFGHTMNTAARMESTGIENMIHVSKKTADLIIAAGHDNWVAERGDMVEAKGIGKLQTYFLNPKRSGPYTASVTSTVHHEEKFPGPRVSFEDVESDDQRERLVNWMVRLFGSILQDIQHHRKTTGVRSTPVDPESYMTKATKESPSVTTVRDEVQELIELPEFSEQGSQDVVKAAESEGSENAESTRELDPVIVSELRNYIRDIALGYNDNAFHNFEHACQVTMATKKLLSRIVAPNDDTIEGMKDLHDNTYGITSDPLTQFAVLFSALIHDVDHPGVSNQQLVDEGAHVAEVYDGKSVSEQHSIDLSWYLLLETDYTNLRNAIVSNEVEFQRFRQLVVNSVMATDIFDKELKAIRDSRWEKAFDEERVLQEGGTKIFSNRRATIVIEHVIQASDIAHCMQHWKVYQLWNKKLFQEMYSAYVAGRAAKNPADGWYKGELWFFDNYIIPLAKKLKECGVFGVSCDEFLDCARDNREEWKQRGEEITRKMLAEVEAK